MTAYGTSGTPRTGASGPALSRIALLRWLVGHTRALLPTLGIAVVARIANQVLGVALLVVFAQGLLAAASVTASIGGSGGRGGTAGVLFRNDDGDVRFGLFITLLVVLALAKAALRYLEHYSGHWVAFTALQRLRELFFARLVPQAPAATQGRVGAELTERATRDIDRVEVFFAHTLPPAVSAVIVPGLVLVWLGVSQSAVLAWALVPFVVAIVLIVPLLASPVTWSGARAVAEGRGRVAEHLGDDLQGVREVLAFGVEDARLDGLESRDRALTRARGGLSAVRASRSVIITLLEAGALIALVLLAFSAGLPQSVLVIALAAAIGLRGPARGVDDFAVGLDASFAAAARLHEVIEAEPLVRDPAGEQSLEATADPGAEPDAEEYDANQTMKVPTLIDEASASASASSGGARARAVEFDAVTFAYPTPSGGTEQNSPLVLDDVTFASAAGRWSAVVGVSGSGKSTLGALLLRDWDPDNGTVRLFGTPVDALPLDALRARVGLVDQRPTLLAGTVADNLRLAAPDASDAEVRAALDIVDLGDWADSLPDGPDTVLGSAAEVSGGQLQRLALARTLLAEPEVLVLDEALSQLDAATADVVRRRLREHRRDLTVIEITHRVDLLPDDCPVTVLDAGRVLEVGTVGGLRGAGSAFDRLLARVV